MDTRFKYGFFAIRKDDGKEFYGKFNEYYPKDDHIICGDNIFLYYQAFHKILIRNQGGLIVWRWDGEKAFYV